MRMLFSSKQHIVLKTIQLKTGVVQMNYNSLSLSINVLLLLFCLIKMSSYTIDFASSYNHGIEKTIFVITDSSFFPKSDLT